jgi:hypothetical protein
LAALPGFDADTVEAVLAAARSQHEAEAAAASADTAADAGDEHDAGQMPAGAESEDEEQQ